MRLELMKYPNPNETMKTLTKPSCNISMEELLTVLRNICDKHVTLVNRNFDIYRVCWHKTTLHSFLLRTSDSIIG